MVIAMKKRKLVLIIISSVLAVAVAAGGAWFLFFRNQDDNNSAKKSKKKPADNPSVVTSSEENNSSEITGSSSDPKVDFDNVVWPSTEDENPVTLTGPERKITVDASKIINEDYYGAGVNIIPTCLMVNNLNNGYNEQYWELDKKRILMLQPKVARVWFQVDWFETSKGVYDFNTEKMQAFYKYLDILKQTGTEIELDFSWKIGRSIQSWYCIPGVTVDYSAPRDIDVFAASCSVALNQLIQNMGYTNIKYLTFYNEPNGNWDFESHGDQRAYYLEMVKRTDQRLKDDGLRDLIQIWGPEETNSIGWSQYMIDNGLNLFDTFSFHSYNTNYLKIISEAKTRSEAAGSNKRVALTEYAEGQDTVCWDTGGHADALIATANSGASTALMWKMSGCWLEDPNESTSTNDSLNLWDALQVGGTTPNRAYYQYCLLSRYVPAHSQVLYTSANGADDVRTAAFQKNGDYTIVVECKKSIAKNIEINFSNMENKTFYRHVYNIGMQSEENALLPEVSKTFTDVSTISDTAGENYCILVYTTLKAQTQVKLDEPNFVIKAGQTKQITASVIDGDQGVTYSIASGNGSVTSDGVFTAPSYGKRGDMTAVKVTSNSDPSVYAIALVAIR